jgi:predicted RecB family nuclease
MPDIKKEECETCRFEKDCQYKENEGADLSFMIANPDGTCQKRQPKEEGIARHS